MLIAVFAVQLVVLAAILALLLRTPTPAPQDPAVAALPRELGGIISDEARRTREDSASAAASLRNEVINAIATLGEGLKSDLKSFREDNSASSDRLRSDVEQKMRTISQGFADFKTETSAKHASLEESLNRKLVELMERNNSLQDQLRTSVQDRLDKLNSDNTAKLDEMRKTVDEKLHATLQTRLTESFGLVTDQLTKVHEGLGQMNSLSAGVNDLNRIFSNVKSRGGFAEVQLGKLLEQVLAPGQYVENAHIKPNSQEVVEYAVRFPGASGEVLLPIDAKFPREDWERLETAYEHGTQDEIESARRAFDAAIRTEGKRICSKYIYEPVTTPYAIMFLPTESLYAEVLRRDGLQSELHLECRVMVAGPSNLYALLTSFQLGFRMLNLQKKGNEVWKVLAAAQNEFGKFGMLMDKMDKQVGTVQNTIRELGTRTRAINRTLRDVGTDDSTAALPAPAASAFDGFLPQLSASGEGE